MGSVRTKTIKKAARKLVEKYYSFLTTDFTENKLACQEFASIATKRLRNKIAGYVTILMKRVKKGPVRGISLKIQEEQRERMDNYVPEVSCLDVPKIEVDEVTMKMLSEIGFSTLSRVSVVKSAQ